MVFCTVATQTPRTSIRIRESRNRPFFIEKKTGTKQGKKRTLKSCVGKLKISKKQGDKLGIEAYKRHSPLLEKCCLVLSANESYQRAENDILLLTGLKVGHSTHQRKVQQIEVNIGFAQRSATYKTTIAI
nr:hypothetical protein A5482_13340 [Cyanobacterium sp. IPPAS B-1200]